MSLRYYFAKAQKTLNRITPYDRAIIDKQCRLIRIAEEQLHAAGRASFLRCYSVCEGLCCRNLYIDSVIGFSDFIYLLTVENQLQERISSCLEHEKLFYAGDCVFLINGCGPCIFPPTARPEVCITTFCTDVKPVKKEIRFVKSQFMKLNFYLFFLNLKSFGRYTNNKCNVSQLNSTGSWK